MQFPAKTGERGRPQLFPACNFAHTTVYCKQTATHTGKEGSDMKRFLRLLIWDALYCVVPAVGYAASASVGASAAADAVTLLTCAVCGAFLSQLSRWGTSWMEILFVALPGLYLALAPWLAPWLNALALSFDPVPAALLTARADALRMAGALAAGFLLWQNVFLRVRR